jgi:hypothetical protein
MVFPPFGIYARTFFSFNSVIVEFGAYGWPFRNFLHTRYLGRLLVELYVVYFHAETYL